MRGWGVGVQEGKDDSYFLLPDYEFFFFFFFERTLFFYLQFVRLVGDSSPSYPAAPLFDDANDLQARFSRSVCRYVVCMSLPASLSVCVSLYLCLCLRACVCVRALVYVCAPLRACVCVCVYMCVYVCVYACVC